MAEQEDTEAISVEDLLGLSDEDIADAKKKLPDATTVRVVVVGILVFVGAAIGKQDLSHVGWLDTFVSAYTVAAPLGLAWWIHRHKKETKAAINAGPVSTGKHAKP